MSANHHSFIERRRRNQRHRNVLTLVFVLVLFIAVLVPLAVTVYFDIPAWMGSIGVFLLLASGYWSSYNTTKEGGHAVARMVNAQRLLRAHLQIKEYRQLNNVVEETCVAAMVKKPALYVAPDTRINAFVSGWHHGDTVLVVNVGALYALERDELQALVAHEMSHLLQEDTEHDMTLLRWTLTFSWIKDIGFDLIDAFFEDEISLDGTFIMNKDRGFSFAFVFVLGGFLLIFGWFFALFSQIMRFSITKKREYIADAQAVQLTRLDTGMTRLLRKVKYEQSQQTVKPRDNRLAHLLTFGSGSGFFGMFDTHPSLDARLIAIQGHTQTALPFAFETPVVMPKTVLDNALAAHEHEINENKRPFSHFENLLEIPEKTMQLLLLLTGMQHKKQENVSINTHKLTIIDAVEPRSVNTLSNKHYFRLLNQACDRAQRWTLKQKKILLRTMKTHIYADKRIDMDEYLWYTLIKFRLFPPQNTARRQPTCQEIDQILRLFYTKRHDTAANKNQHVSELETHIKRLCAELNLDWDKYRADKIDKTDSVAKAEPLDEARRANHPATSLKVINDAVLTIQAWRPLHKPVLSLSLAAVLDVNDKMAVLKFLAVCTAIDTPIPQDIYNTLFCEDTDKDSDLKAIV